MRRLRTPECQALLEQLRDGVGRPLAARLAVFGVPADQYLAMVPFLDGTGRPLCTGGQSQLLTQRGVARVLVCLPFLETVVRERETAEAYVIHEMLHTLGLGENPPSSQEITQRVKRQCLPFVKRHVRSAALAPGSGFDPCNGSPVHQQRSDVPLVRFRHDGRSHSDPPLD